MVRLIPTMSYS